MASREWQPKSCTSFRSIRLSPTLEIDASWHRRPAAACIDGACRALCGACKSTTMRCRARRAPPGDDRRATRSCSRSRKPAATGSTTTATVNSPQSTSKHSEESIVSSSTKTIWHAETIPNENERERSRCDGQSRKRTRIEPPIWTNAKKNIRFHLQSHTKRMRESFVSFSLSLFSHTYFSLSLLITIKIVLIYFLASHTHTHVISFFLFFSVHYRVVVVVVAVSWFHLFAVPARSFAESNAYLKKKRTQI